MQGTVKFLSPSGYGFITIGEHNLIYVEYFFHRDAVVAGVLPRKGDEVEFLLADDRRGHGLIATQVKRLGYPD